MEKGKKVVYQELLICDHKILIQSAVGLGGHTRTGFHMLQLYFFGLKIKTKINLEKIWVII